MTTTDQFDEDYRSLEEQFNSYKLGYVHEDGKLHVMLHRLDATDGWYRTEHVMDATFEAYIELRKYTQQLLSTTTTRQVMLEFLPPGCNEEDNDD